MNYCRNCHAVTYGKDGWRYINKYNRYKLCRVRNHGVEKIPDEWATESWLEEQKMLHEMWKREHTA